MDTPFSLLETILYTPKEGFYLLDRHLQRLEQSAIDFGFIQPNKQYIKDQLAAKIASSSTPQRVRLLYDAEGHVTIEQTPLSTKDINLDEIVEKRVALLPTLKLKLDTQPTNTVNQPFVRHKTTRRAVYNNARERAQVGTDDIFDVVLWNTDHQVTETSIANIAVGTNTNEGKFIWKTPTTSSGLLPGVFRQHLLDQGSIIEAEITTDDLIKAQQEGDIIVCFNSVRKVYRVCLIE